MSNALYLASMKPWPVSIVFWATPIADFLEKNDGTSENPKENMDDE